MSEAEALVVRETVKKLAELNEMEIITSNCDEVTTSFDAMGLQAHLISSLLAYGYDKPTALQQVGNTIMLTLTL
jgi:hypothetical protein